MMTFERVWCEKAPTDTAYLGQWLRAKSASGQLIEGIDWAVSAGKTGKLRHMLKRNRISEHNVTDEKAKELITRYLDEVEAQSE